MLNKTRQDTGSSQWPFAPTFEIIGGLWVVLIGIIDQYVHSQHTGTCLCNNW